MKNEPIQEIKQTLNDSEEWNDTSRTMNIQAIHQAKITFDFSARVLYVN